MGVDEAGVRAPLIGCHGFEGVNGYAKAQACGITCAANSLTRPGRAVWIVGVASVRQYRGDLRYIVYASVLSIFRTSLIELM
jgi:hypothetical protein